MTCARWRWRGAFRTKGLPGSAGGTTLGAMARPRLDPIVVQGTYERLSANVMVAGMVAGLVLALEVGFRISRHGPPGSSVATLRTAVLEISSLLLAFSYWLAEARFDERRLLVVDEANAIGSFYLRLGFLPSPLREELRRHVIAYVRDRVENPQALAHGAHSQLQMWALLERHAAELSSSVHLLLTGSLNELIDLSAKRVSALQARLPWLVVLLLFTVVFSSGLVIGYQPDADHRSLFQWLLFTLVVGMVMFTLLDLDRPTAGIILGNTFPLIELQHFIQLAESEPERPGEG